MPWTLGVLERPLGNARLQTACLIATLLGSNSSAVSDELVRLGTISVLLVRSSLTLVSSSHNSFVIILITGLHFLDGNVPSCYLSVFS